MLGTFAQAGGCSCGISLTGVESQVKANILNVDLQGRNSRALFTWFPLPCGTARLKSERNDL